MGTRTCALEAADVDQVLAALAARGGAAAAEVLRRAQVWVNGQPAEPGTALAADDEVAIVPPVSGGAT